MWKEPEPDPGGYTQEAPSSAKPSQESLLDLRDQNEQQQLLIAQLKEMLRKEQSNVTQEKVEEYMNTLSKAKVKKNRAKREESGSFERGVGTSSSSSGKDVAKKQKLNLLKQQLEENKVRLAERGKSQKGIEEMVIQLKAQLNDSQQLIPPSLSIIEPKNLDYSKNSSQEELYNILLTKEKKITDLLSKVQKQEATILDLEENVKEKDSVIDARTKAITLMTDSLSKKGKSTLDALDDTKEQMRKMQENFVTLESEMKARQVKLLNDLKAKNLEIVELQDSNKKLLEEKLEMDKIIEEFRQERAANQTDDSKHNTNDLQKQLDETLAENNSNLLKVAELEKKLKESIEDLNRLKNTGMSVSTYQSNDEEVAKLKKQLEENNKNMIKVKAQSKAKIKELNKKLDQIKKASDANVLIVQLQTENTKLSEKIAELEEEKGNMQLKMVESSDSMKDSLQLEEIKELEHKLTRSLEELEEKDKIISLLESEIISLKEETTALNEKITNLSHLENSQVSSEIKSIQLEEQLEEVEKKSIKLREEIEHLRIQKEEMAEQIEELKKQNQEINMKLENYIQENMELMDKLEKLSAEKVSSAESIEIVEGLTQQEKLEFSAYQKNLEVHMEDEPIKCVEDDQIEPPPELNESVLQLSEDSTELLQKIDMFNMERKEVMIKMEALKDENNQLNMKLKEIENNRDILAETYEQLQTEKEELQSENDILVKKLQNIEHSQEEVKDDKSESVSLAKLQELQSDYEKLLAENEKLRCNLKEYDTQIHEKHSLEFELKEARDKVEELETKIRFNLEEVTNYQTVIDDNKNELINSANLINDLQTKLGEREKEIFDMNIIINDLNQVVNNLQMENNKLGNFEFMESQVAELKAALNKQIQQAQDYEEEIARNNDTITDLNTRLIDMNKKIIEAQHEVEVKDIEYKRLVEDLQEKDGIIMDLRSQLDENNSKVSSVIKDMKEKYLSLQKQLDGNSGSLEARITELTNKNKEQMDKMKKIAANLKKKSQAYQELEEKYATEKEKWEMEVNEKSSVILDAKDKMSSVVQQLNEIEEELNVKNLKLEQSEARIIELMEMIQNFEQSKMELLNTITELKHREQKLSEVSLKQELSTSLHEDFDNIPTNQDSANEEKIKELELIIETNENDIKHYNDRTCKLEEDVARLEQEKEELIQRTMELSEQLNITSKSVEEKSFVEEELGQKLLQVTANDEVLIKKLEEATEENRELLKKSKEIEEVNLKLKVKLKKAHERVTQLKSFQTNFEELENANNELKKQLAILETNQKHIQDENLELQKQNQNDYEKIEADYQAQLEELVGCRHQLTVECEKLREKLKEMEQREEDLLSEIAEYKQKLEEEEAISKEKMEELADEARVATFNWKDSQNEIKILKQQVANLETELINKIARETVESIVCEAEDRVKSMRTISSQTDHVGDKKVLDSSIREQVKEVQTAPSSGNQNEVQSETVPTFHWPEAQTLQQPIQSEDWFSTDAATVQHGSNDWFNRSEARMESNPFRVQSESHQLAASENSKEELLKKIKALEFLLYNIDKEKEEAFQECTRMVNELTRLVYEKVNSPNKEDKVTTHERVASQPVSDLESQIMSQVDITDATSNKKELQSIEFERTSPSLGEQSFPVVEEVMQPKRAYLTYQPEDKAIKPEVFGENDDGWGWGPEEAKLEEEHQFKTESDPQIQNLRSEIDRLNEALQVLQVERDNHLEEIKQLQIKSGKLIKKCKELKLKNDQLVERQHNKKSEGADFLDLDAAIEEELKMQIAQLEKKIKEVTNELEKEKQEKGNVLKRVEVLVSANDRMSDMKEIQDNEVLHWKRKYEEIEEKLQQYEWSSDGFNEGTKPKSRSDPEASSSQDDVRKIEELEQTIRDLALDNEELHLLLEEQRQIRINLEKVKTGSENAKMEEDQKKLLLLEDQVKALDQELKLKALEMEKVLHEKSSILTQNEMLQNTIQEKEEQFKNLEMKFKLISGRNEELEKLLEDNKMIKDSQENKKDRKTQEILSCKVKELETEISQLNDHKVYQDQLLKEKEIAFTQLMTSFEQVSMMREELDLQIKQLTNDLFQSKQQYDDLLSKNSKTTSELNEVINDREECVALRAELDDLNNELGLQKQINDQVKVDANFKINELAKNLEEQEQKYNQLYNEYTEKVTEVEKLSHQVQKEEQESSTNDPFQWAQEKYRLETLLADKESAYNELKIQKEDLEKQLESLRNTLDEKQKDYDQLLSEVDEKIAKTAKELEETWIVQVDQRGADIAESWKLHLESVEAEFSSVTEKMKYEISELEQKCSALMNENNELRRNVDVEIRNDVDRISALQQQITDLQQYVSELDNKLVEMQNENESLISELTAIKIEKDTLFNDAKEKESRLASLSIVVDTTQKQFDEKREVVEEIVRILEKNTSFPISFEKQDVLSEFQRQLNLVNMKEQEILDLTQSIENLRNQLGSIQEKEQEISRLRQVEEDLQNQVQLGLEKDNEIAKLKRLIEDLQKQLFLAHEKDEELMNMHKLVEDLQRQLQSVNEKDGEINRLKALVGELEAQLSFVQEKDGEIFRLNQIIENYKVQQEFSNKELDKLRLEHYTANMTIEEYKNKLEDFNAAYVILQNSLEEKNQLIATLNQQLQLTEGLKNDNNQDVEKLQEEISVIKKDCSVLQQSLAECQEQLFKVTNELTSTTSQLESVNQQLAYSQQNFEIQEGELNRLRDVLQAKEQEYNTSVENLKRWHLRDLENHYEELLSAKDLDIESIKSQLHESIENSNRLAENLGAEENLRRELQSKVKELEEKVVEQTALLDEEERQLTAVRSIIEQQVIKIEELKKELFNKSSDYDSLIAEMDIGRKAITQQPVSTAPVNQPVTSERVQPPEEDLSEPVSRAELDLALYMLHQRDVRCEELTVELTQLLEERDTLQLRLSNALREKEEIRKKLAGSEDVPASSTSTSNPSTPHSKSSAIFIAASGTELAAEPTEGSTEVQNLESKLSELKKIGYKKDKTFVDEQEFRRMQQMSIMQQHINEASKLPPEAAAKLVDASYTLSRDVQSPSKVLLNWLWGRSTPKVNDT